MPPKYTIIVPTYNEGRTVNYVINNIQETFNKEDYEIIVVNDGSTDNTEEMLAALSKDKENLVVISYKDNRGKGYAIRRGIAYAKGKFIGIHDADVEYNPRDLLILFKISEVTGCVVYGSRFRGSIEGMAWYIYLGNIFLSLLFSLLYRVFVTDIETGHKVFPSKILKSLKLRSDGFDIEIEISAKIAKKGHSILEFPISYTSTNRKYKKLRPFKDGIIALYKIAYFFLFDR